MDKYTKKLESYKDEYNDKLEQYIEERCNLRESMGYIKATREIAKRMIEDKCKSDKIMKYTTLSGPQLGTLIEGYPLDHPIHSEIADWDHLADEGLEEVENEIDFLLKD